MWTKNLNRLQKLYSLYDQELQTWSAAYLKRGGKIYCGRGCANCCTLTVNASFTEALAVAQAIEEASQPLLEYHVQQLREISRTAGDLKTFLGERRRLGGCPFLTESVCTVYQVRPFACRGLLASRNSDWCAVDFSTLHPWEKEAFISSLNQDEVAFPTHYLAAPQERAREMEEESAWLMRQEFGFTITGNFPFLVYLEKSLQLSAIIVNDGYQAVHRLLQKEDLLLPFLINLMPAAPPA